MGVGRFQRDEAARNGARTNVEFRAGVVSVSLSGGRTDRYLKTAEQPMPEFGAHAARAGCFCRTNSEGVVGIQWTNYHPRASCRVDDWAP